VRFGRFDQNASSPGIILAKLVDFAVASRDSTRP
jgi:hypothetical protein